MADVIYYSIVDNIPKIGLTNNQRAIQWLNVTNQTYNKLCENIDNIEFLDSLLSFYSAKKCKKCKSAKSKSSCIITDNLHQYDDALDRLKSFNKGEVGNIIRALETTGLDILIAGSSCLASVMKQANHQFEPRDVDIYLKNISKEKVLLIDKCIREQYGSNQIYLVRRPLTLTWWIIGDDDVVAEIQLNLLQIKSWTEVFSVYHSDMVCIGYQVLDKKFITHKIRWKNFYSKMLTNEIYITDLFSIDTISILQTVKSKYEKRGFNIKIIGKELNNLQGDKQLMSGNMIGQIHMSGSAFGVGGNACAKGDKSKNQKFDMVEYFRQYYAKCDDFQIDINAADVYLDNENPPRLITIRNHGKDDFLMIPYRIEVPNGIECSILCDNTNLVITGNKCTHSISLKAFILHEIKSCPLCRAAIVNPQVRTVDGYNYFKDNYVIAHKKVIDEIIISPRDRPVSAVYDSDEDSIEFEPLILPPNVYNMAYEDDLEKAAGSSFQQNQQKIEMSDILSDISDFDSLSEEKIKKMPSGKKLKGKPLVNKPQITSTMYKSEDEEPKKKLIKKMPSVKPKKGKPIVNEPEITTTMYDSEDEKLKKKLIKKISSDDDFEDNYMKKYGLKSDDFENKKTVHKITSITYESDDEKNKSVKNVPNIMSLDDFPNLDKNMETLDGLDGSDEEYFTKYVKEQNIQYHSESESELESDYIEAGLRLSESTDEFRRAQKLYQIYAKNIRKKYPVHGSKKDRKSSDESIPEMIDILSDVDVPSKYTSSYQNSMVMQNLDHETFGDSSGGDNLEKSKKKLSSIDSVDSIDSAEFIERIKQLIDNNEKLLKQNLIDDTNRFDYGSRVTCDDVIVGKVTPISAMEKNQKKYKDSSKVYIYHAEGNVDKIYNNDGYDVHNIKNQTDRTACIGDQNKFLSEYIDELFDE